MMLLQKILYWAAITALAAGLGILFFAFTVACERGIAALFGDEEES